MNGEITYSSRKARGQHCECDYGVLEGRRRTRWPGEEVKVGDVVQVDDGMEEEGFR